MGELHWDGQKGALAANRGLMYKLFWDFDYCPLIEGASHLTVGRLMGVQLTVLKCSCFLWCSMLCATVFVFRFASCRRVLQLLL